MMKTLTLYVLSTFVKIFGFVFPVFIGLYLVVEFVERIDDFLQYQASMGTILRYLLLRIPVVGVEVGPLAVLLSVALGVALFQRSREIIALLAAGASPWRIIHPFLLGAFVMAGISLGTEELILPGAHRALMDLLQDQRRSPPPGALIQQGEIWFRASEMTFVHIELLDPAAERIHGITIYRRDASGELIEQVHAREALWLGGQWTLLDGTISRFHGNLATHVDSFSRLEMPIGMEPEALWSMFIPPSHMSLSELKTYMRKLRDRGVDMTIYARDFQTKLATPCMAVIMAVIGLAAMWGTHDTRKISFGFVCTLCGAAAYWLIMLAGTALSATQQLPLTIGIWVPHLVVLGLSSFVFWRKTFG
ncbi:MAG TPA: LptF/LptG family permease [Candidatus Binatia bacterium]|nr:LptF/LptG family permease [Candidatus Binatia bacterium]